MFKIHKGKIEKAVYNETDGHVFQKLDIAVKDKDGVMHYHTTWAIYNNFDFFLEGDEVTFLSYHGIIRAIRISR